MITFIQILVSTFAISAIGLVGVLTFFLKQELLNRAVLIMVAVSAGALLGGAFLHLLPEAIDEAGASLDIFLYLLLGFCLFFILEHFLRWRHAHNNISRGVEPFSYLILVSDTVHNFIDGVAIAAGFMASYPTGIITTLAIALHEIPQELGDFGVLVYGGFSRRRALTFNYISSIAAILGGITGYFASSIREASIFYLLSFAAGSFIYIAAADLIPEIKYRTDPRGAIISFFVFLAGIGIMLAVK